MTETTLKLFSNQSTLVRVACDKQLKYLEKLAKNVEVEGMPSDSIRAAVASYAEILEALDGVRQEGLFKDRRSPEAFGGSDADAAE